MTAPSSAATEWLPELTPATGRANGEKDWRKDLLMNDKGAPRAVLANAITALGVEWTDHEDRLTADWLQHQGIYVSVDIAGLAVQTVARDHIFHPVRQKLESLEWDGTKRIDDWLSLYLGAEFDDYTSAVGARWLISAVARIYQPGAKADCALILKGDQGLMKSTSLKTLAEPWFTDEIAELGSKDAAMQTRGVWIIEIAELDSMTRAEVPRSKDSSAGRLIASAHPTVSG